MRLNHILSFILLVLLIGCASNVSKPIDAETVIANPSNYDGKNVAIRGYLVTDGIYIPHLFASSEDAAKPRNDNYGIDLLPANRELDVKSRLQTITCVVLYGVFHAPTPLNKGMGALTSKVGSIDFDRLEKCK